MEDNIILLVLKKQLDIVLLEDISSEILVNEQVFKQKDYGDFNGFYDWLRNHDNKIVGLRYFLFEDYQFIIDSFRYLDYVETELTKQNNSILNIYFSEKRTFIDEISNDQLFIDNYIYKSELNEYAITFCLPDNGVDLIHT